MTLTIRAHYDGRVIVPDEPVDLTAGERLEVSLRSVPDTEQTDEVAARLRRLASATGRVIGPVIPAEALRRENLYEDPE